MVFQLLEGRLDRRSRAIETVVRALGVGLYEARHQTKADQIYEGEVFLLHNQPSFQARSINQVTLVAEMPEVPQPELSPAHYSTFNVAGDIKAARIA